MMETDLDRAPSLHLNHTDTDITCSAKQDKQEQLKKTTLKAAKKRVHKDGENSQLDTEEGEHKSGERDQEETEDGTRNPSLVEQTDCEQSITGKLKRQATTQEVFERIMQDADSEEYSDDEASQSEDETNPEDEFVLESDSSCDSVESEEDTEETVSLSAHEWKSKNGKIVWSSNHTKTLHCFPASSSVPGPSQYARDHISTLKSCFDLFMTEEIIQLILQNTNVQGRRSVKEWKDIDVTDLQAYIGLLILGGVYRSHNEATSNLWDRYTGRSIFEASMPLPKFNLINSNLRFDDRLTRPAHLRDDKLAAIRTIWEKWEQRLPLLFNLGQDVYIDEQIIPFRGRCGFPLHVQSKPKKCGIKVFVTCDINTSYAWKMQIYTGNSAGCLSEDNQEKNVVLDITKGLQGNTVTCVNYLTSYELGEELLKRNLTLVGTMRKRKQELPPQLLWQKHRAPRSSLFAFTKTHTVVSYIPKRRKNVLLLSTKHREPDADSADHQEPKIITDYNHCKKDIENLSKSVDAYSCRMRRPRWPQVLFYYMLDVSANNAFVLWSAVDPSWNKNKSTRHRLFLEELGKKLVAPQMQRRQQVPRTSDAASAVSDLKHWTAPLESEEDLERSTNKRRRPCYFCTVKKRKISTTCTKCGKYACKYHTILNCSLCYT